MARISDNEREAIKQGADAARTALPKLRQQRADLDERISSLESLIKADDLFNGPRKTKAETSDVGEVSEPTRKRVRRGQVPKHIDAVLADGIAKDEPTIRQKIKETYGETYGRATVYTALCRGAKDHRYLKDGMKWKLSGLVTLKSA